MWTLVALFCNLTEPSKGQCQAAIPPIIFLNKEDCIKFAIAETPKIPLDKVSYDYQCVSWDKI
jgi:hypothetical protein